MDDSQNSTLPRRRWPNHDSPTLQPQDGARRVLIVGYVIIGLVTAGLLVVLGRVVQLQTRPDTNIAALKDTQTSTVPILARRASLTDRRGRVLTSSRIKQRLYVDPLEIEDPGTFSERVASQLGYDPAWIEQTVNQRLDRRYVVLDRYMSDDRADRMAGFKLRGLGVEPHVIRDYPQGKLGGALLGYVNADGVGIEGLEKLFDKELRGKPGSITYLRDARRTPIYIDQRDYKQPVDGKPVRLSLDLMIQSYAETELTKACQDFGAASGEMVVMDPRTGEILAMANYPSVDLNEFGKTRPENRRNRCVTDTYEPGSTFKPFIWAGALEAGIFSPSEIYDCTTSGAYRFASGRNLHDAHPVGTVTAEKVLIMSSNIGMGKISTELGNAATRQAMKRFGFGDPTGAGLPGEVSGRVWPLSRWSKYSITSVSMGQEVSVTALQMARAFSVFANGGLLPTPTIRAIDPSDSSHPPIMERVLKPTTAARTREVLRRVVTEGTGKKANSDLYPIFGKTGTAQIAGPRGGYIPDAYNASFVCGAPVDHPRVVVLCVIHHPDRRKGHFGGTVAAPAARRVVEQSLIYLGIPPVPAQDVEQTTQLAAWD